MSLLLAKSQHQQNVEAFMLRAKQDIPVTPTVPSPKVRILRAKLILEEALETIAALAVTVVVSDKRDPNYCLQLTNGSPVAFDFCETAYKEPDMVEVVDGCCDLRVVTTGTLSACGVPDEYVQALVDRNNLYKFAPGHSLREDGKLIKPPGHKAPAITNALNRIIMNILSESRGNDANPYATPTQARQANRPVPSEPSQPRDPGPHDSVGRYKTSG